MNLNFLEFLAGIGWTPKDDVSRAAAHELALAESEFLRLAERVGSLHTHHDLALWGTDIMLASVHLGDRRSRLLALVMGRAIAS